MEELDRVLAAEEVYGNECVRGLTCREGIEAGQRCNVPEFCPVAQSRRRPYQLGCVVGEAREAAGDRMRDGLRAKLVQSRRVRSDRWNAFLRCQVEQRA